MNISVVGLGKLGAVLAGVMADKGHEVVGVDVNPAARRRDQSRVSRRYASLGWTR